MDDTIEIEGSSEEEAAQRASEALNTVRENLGYEIISEGKKRSLMGLMSGKKKKIKIRAWRRDERGDDEFSEVPKRAKESLHQMVKHICEDFTIEAIELSENLTLQVEGDEGGLLIGKNGTTLDALQFIVRKSMAREFPEYEKQIIVDTEGYRERRRDSLISMAKRIASKVRSSKRKEFLRPMNAYERRLVHMALQDESGVRTESQGDGQNRCIVIHPDKSSRGGSGSGSGSGKPRDKKRTSHAGDSSGNR